jgi:hypothetical protein
VGVVLFERFCSVNKRHQFFFLLCFLSGLCLQKLQAFSDYLFKKNIFITSDQQMIDSDGIWHARGRVSVILGNQVHIFADYIQFNEKEQKIFFYADQSKNIKVIKNDLCCLMKQLICDLKDESCFADLVQGFYKKSRLMADSAIIFASGEIALTNVSFTSCNKKNPHWQFLADRATYTIDQKLVVQGVWSQWGTWLKIPLPVKEISYALRPTSGFLIPSFFLEKRGGYGFKIPYYQYINEDIDIKYLLQWYAKKGATVQQRFRFFYPWLSGTLWSSYGTMWGYDDGIALTRLDRAPFFLQGDLFVVGTYTNKYALIGFSSFHEGIDSRNIDLFFEGAFWKDRRTEYRIGTSFSDQKSFMAGFFEIKKYAVSESFIESAQAVLLVKKTYDYAARLPAIYWWRDYFSDSGSFWIRPHCLVDAIFYKKEEADVSYQSSNQLRYYRLGKKNMLFEDGLLRARPVCEIGLTLKTREQIFIAQVEQGLLLYGLSRLQSQKVHVIPHIRSEIQWVFPELLCAWSDGFIRSHNQISLVYQPFFEQKNNQIQSFVQRGYDGEDYRYQEAACWIKQQYQWNTSFGLRLFEWQQGIDWSDYQAADQRYRQFSPGLSFPWRCLISIDQREAGCYTNISGAWGERKGLLHQGSIACWKEYKSCRFEGKYVYVNPDIALLRGLSDVGHFCMCSLIIRSGNGFKGMYQGSWGIDVDKDNKRLFALRRQSIQVWWTFDCWRLGLGAEYQSYRIASVANNFWRALFSFQLLFF